MITYIYAILDPRGEMKAYVGKSIHPVLRLREHISDYSANREKVAWMRELKALNKKPILYILEETTKNYEHEREAFWMVTLPAFGFKMYNKHRIKTLGIDKKHLAY